MSAVLVDPQQVARTVSLSFGTYRESPSPERLSELYEALDPIIVRSMRQATRMYRASFPTEFLDIEQDVKLALFESLEKIANSVVDASQLMRIIYSAATYRWCTSYRQHLKMNGMWAEFKQDLPWDSKYKYPIWVTLGVSGDPESVYLDGNTYSGNNRNAGGVFSDKKAVQMGTFYQPYFDSEIFMRALPSKVLDEALLLNRFGHAVRPVLEFCITSLLAGRQPSVAILSRYWDIDQPHFWPKYAVVLLRLAMLRLSEVATS